MQKRNNDDRLLRAARGSRARVILQGWLSKRENGGIKGYAKRWVVLRDNRKLLCYKKPDLPLRASLDLSLASTVATNAQIKREIKRTDSKRKLKLNTSKAKVAYVFKVVTSDDVWKLKAATQRDHDEWVTALRKTAFGDAEADPLDMSAFTGSNDKFGSVEDLRKLSKNLYRENPKVSDRFFNQTADLIDDLFTSLIERNDPSDDRDRKEFMSLINKLFNFCNDNVATFSLTWPGNKPADGLSSCLILINLINEILNGTYGVASYERDDEEVEMAFTNHVRDLVHRGIVSAHQRCVEEARVERQRDDSITSANSQDEDGTKEQYVATDRAQMTKILQKMEYQLNADVVNFAETFRLVISDLDLEQMYAEYSIAHVWTDAKMSLLAPCEGQPEIQEPISQDVWDLFRQMENFHEFLSGFYKLDASQISLWAVPFVDRWLKLQNTQSNATILKAVFEVDQWTCIDLGSGQKHSQSLEEFFKHLEKMTEQFTRLPYNQDHLNGFIDLLSRLTLQYLEKNFDDLESILASEREKKEDWGYFPGPLGKLEVRIPEQMLVRMNNIFSLTVKLKGFLDDVDLQKLFSTCYGADRNIFLSAPAFRFNEIFNTIPDMLTTIRKSLVEGACTLTTTQVSLIVTQNPEEGYSKDDLEKLLLVRCWNDLMPKLDQFETFLYEPLVQDLFVDILEQLLRRLELHLLPEKTINVLSVAQTVRVMYMVDMFEEFLKTNHLNKDRVEKMHVRTRIKVLTELLVSGSQRIIDHYQLLQDDEEKNGVGESHRIEHPPYIDRRRLWKVLNWRSTHIKDKVATNFISKTKKPTSPRRLVVTNEKDQNGHNVVKNGRVSGGD